MTLKDLTNFLSNPVGSIQQGITNWATNNPQPAKSLINLGNQVNTFKQQLPQQLNTAGQLAINRSYPQQVPQINYPGPLKIISDLQNKLSDAGRNFMKSNLSNFVQSATIGTPESLQQIKALTQSIYDYDPKTRRYIRNDEKMRQNTEALLPLVMNIGMSSPLSINKLTPLRGMGKDLSRMGYTAEEIFKKSPAEAQRIFTQDATQQAAKRMAQETADKEIAQIAQRTPVTKKVNLLDYFRTPDRVLKKIGLEKEMTSLRKGYDTYQQQLPEELGKVVNWMKRVPGEESNVKIYNYLDGKLGKGSSLTPTEMQVASEIKGYLSNWADKLKLPKYQRVSEYITRLYNIGQIKQEFDEDLAKIIDPEIAKSVYNPFLQKRVGQRIDYLQNTWGALQAYIKRATRKVNMDPALELLAAKEPALELSQWKYIKRLVDTVNMRPSEVDNLIDNTIKSIPGVGYKFGQRPTAMLSRTARQMVYRGTIGMNFSSVIRNLTQGANSYAELGERWTVTGYLKLAKNWKSGELEKVGVLKDSFVQDQQLSVFKQLTSKLDKGLFYLFGQAEKVNRGAAYFGAKTRGLSQGLSEAQAIDYAKALVRRTQFAFGAIDTPLALNSDISKTFTQLQSFTLKQGEFLFDKVYQKQFVGLIRWIGATLVMKELLKREFGMNIDILPNFGLNPILQAGQAGLQAFGGNIDEAKKSLLKTIPAFIPGGVQMKKTYEGLTDVSRGYSQTNAGNIRYPIQQSPANYLRGSLFGKYSVPESSQYYDSGANVLGKNQSAQFIQSNNKEQFYQDILNKRVETARDQTLKAQVKSTGQPIQEGNKYYFVDVKGNPKVVNLSTLNANLPAPTLTGNPEVDKKTISQFNSELSQRGRDIYVLYQAGRLTASQAEAMIADLQKIKISAPKTVRTARVSAPRVKKITIKKPKMIKIKKPKSLASLMIKIKRAPKIKKIKIRKNLFVNKPYFKLI